MDEMTQGIVKEKKRLTERYSFEIYSDQKPLIRKVQSIYEEHTGKSLPKSRVIREALEEYLNRVLNETSTVEGY